MRADEPKLPSVDEIVAGVSKYFRDERDMYRRHSEPLDIAIRAGIAAFFDSKLLDKLKTVTLRGVRIPPPPFYLQAKEMSGGSFPDFVHLSSVTYLDVIVFHEGIQLRTLFHGAVHAAQMEVLGFERYVQLYVGGFLKHRSWAAIPLEDQAYRLEARFVASPSDGFSVEAEIRKAAHNGLL
jgi:hypothetical protein